MEDPKLKTTGVVIKYRSDDGYESEMRTGNSYMKNQAPEAGFLKALEELARLTALFGFEDEALQRFNAARERVFEWRKQREAA